MSITSIIISLIALGIIIGAVLVLKQSAKKFNLTPEQLADIKARNDTLAKEEKDDQ